MNTKKEFQQYQIWFFENTKNIFKEKRNVLIKSDQETKGEDTKKQ